jgi:hypothetical protein
MPATLSANDSMWMNGSRRSMTPRVAVTTTPPITTGMAAASTERKISNRTISKTGRAIRSPTEVARSSELW